MIHDRPSIFEFSPDAVEKAMAARVDNYRRYQSDILLKWLYRHKAASFSEMTDLSKETRAALESAFSIETLPIATRQKSIDGAEKFLFRLSDGKEIESVFIPEEKRNTLCISSQVGCKLACTFCLTGKIGFKRHLTAAEIVGQVAAVERLIPDRSITNIVFMGMGEPLENYAAVEQAAAHLNDPRAFDKSRRRITISTSGLADAIDAIPANPPFRLAVSLNAADDETRSRLMPINRRYPLRRLIEAIEHFSAYKTGHNSSDRVTLEYILIDGVNDSLKDAANLHQLTQSFPHKINLMPFNESASFEFRRPSQEKVDAFADHLLARHHTVMVRKSRGVDILAACGQLAGNYPIRRASLG